MNAAQLWYAKDSMTSIPQHCECLKWTKMRLSLEYRTVR
jgi:hypothetical protein